jgi:M6 family metalloprotease-like protein
LRNAGVMKKSLTSITAIALVASVLFALPAAAKTYKTCNELRKVYKYGVASSSTNARMQGAEFHAPRVSSSIYSQNKRLDVDRDGVACEVKKSASSSASPSSAPATGALCANEGQRVSVFDRIFTCSKTSSGKKWSKGELNREFIYSTDDGYLHARSQHCAIDTDAGPEWERFQKYIRNEARNCPFQLRFLTYEMGKSVPTIQLSNRVETVEPCKAANPGRGNWIKGFEQPDRRLKHNVLGRNAVMQIIPIYAPDTASPTNSPQDDYKKYFDFVKKYVAEVSDLPVNFEIRVPDKYFAFSKPLKPYAISHKLPSPHPTALREIMAEVDQYIDFSGATSALLLVPSGTAQDVIQQGPLGYYRSQETELFGVSAQYPATEKLLSARPEFLNLSVPSWWVHEFYHLGVGLDDHYGRSQQERNRVSGMGYWGLMNPGLTDLLGWEKWLLDYIGDSQVACVQASSAETTIWLRPSSVNTTQQKLGVIPLSRSTVLVMESIRGAGLNHHLMPNEQGLLVYKVDTANPEHGFGFDLLYPTNRQFLSGTFPGSFAPLKSGEQINIEGISIKVSQSGNFGDVVTISKTD